MKTGTETTLKTMKLGTCYEVTLLKDAFVKLAFDYKPKMGKVGG
jgi:hypothetical protein